MRYKKNKVTIRDLVSFIVRRVPGLLGEGVGETVDLVPGATGEVRDLDGHVAVLYGDLTKLREAAPLGHVIHIHVERQSVTQAVD